MSVDNVKLGDDLNEAVAALLVDLPIKAASFIVTIYGDVVEPRGGVVWIGNLIETCKSVGITETLVRTAVSRLVTAGQLAGEREGRRSYYRLTDAAQAEFTEAASLFYGPEPAVRWQFVLINGPAPEEIMQGLERDGFARLSPRLAMGTHPAPPLPGRVVIFNAELATENGALKELAEEAWNLPRFAEAYHEFVVRFGAFSQRVGDCAALAPFDCLIARLLLVHQYRLIMLREPHLPKSALPADWPGEEARRLFADLYLRLSRKADGHVGRRFVNGSGKLRETTPASQNRLDHLKSR
ncbi:MULTISPECIES: phenylacetic acid degradation operon negative regulatory protein PaaX [unclassified Rhizobium]|uniref:phenylacetic acid degradation operon negative regulatory protein PaaX n=1 Tax=unclassified Rhizobium TaxID=2613769 RepID=UPI000EAA6437|nr:MULTISPECIES: phenylacetic acid degradation operon negative regulatory protein PaaX [unclassified Rhizobium]AYG69232.1 phenylacetic acid degradation operon negative regulatory protein PaaX [Rhizobium sp. CCGE531]AYG75612.1 phenylacetic acid degradation operon negative regulatory protein PaaX [Rhizobium sp. CCGE532]